jgi:hypothetical protein
MRVESTRMRVDCVWLKKTTTKTKKAKRGACACRSKVYVYYDEFKVIFLMLLVGLDSNSGSQDLGLTCPPSYALGYCVELNMKKKYQSY